jgi:adenylate cyclase
VRWIRESFAAKLFAGLLGTVGVLLAATWLVVRAETNRQVRDATERAVTSATTQFRLLEEDQRRSLERVAGPLMLRRIPAALDAAVETGDADYLTGLVIYELDLAALDDVLVGFTDPEGRPILTTHGSVPMVGADPAGLAPAARTVLADNVPDLVSHRVVEGTLFSVRTRLIAEGGRAIGTLSLGLPVDDAEMERLGGLIGVEVCIVVDGRCVAGTDLGRTTLAGDLTRLSSSSDETRFEAVGAVWSVRAFPLVDDDPGQGRRIVAVPLGPVLAPFQRITRALLVGGGLALVLAVLVGLALSRGLTRPVHALVEATARVARGDYEQVVAVDSRDEMGTLAGAFNQMTQDLRLKERARDVLNKVTSPEVARLLLRDEVKLGGENRAITVLFADVRGFSTLTEGMEPQKVIKLLNQCMERLSRIVDEEGGTVDKYVGDEIMAFWGAPVGHGDHALRAARAALRMQEAMAELTGERAARGETPIRIGVGLNSGVAVAGLMGSPDRWNYTVLGDVVNLAARLCSSAEPGQVVVTAGTLDATGGAAVARSLGARPFKGFTAEIEVFNVERMQSSAAVAT